MKALGIDFGEKRVGLALSDADGEYAIAWKTLDRRSDQQVILEIVGLAAEESIELIVIGDPLGLDGTAGSQSRRVAAFTSKLGAALDLPIETVNESLTSVEADERLRATGLGPKKRREHVDRLAAQILLQEALDRRRETAEHART